MEKSQVGESKRGRGRPRQGDKKQHVDITLEPEIIKALEQVTTNKSEFIGKVLRKELGLQRN